MSTGGERIRLAVTGTTGRLGRALADGLQDGYELVELPRQDFDLRAGDLTDRLAEVDFDVLLHPAAMTSLEACEDFPQEAEKVNALAPAELANQCAALGRRMLHFSTDYVLSGDRPGLHDEDDPIDPQSVYAATKLRSEKAVLAAGACVVRVSWVFGPERPAFPDQVVSRALAGEPLAAIADKTSLPAATADLVEWTDCLIQAGCPNEVIHACNSGEPVSWHDLACRIVATLVDAGKLDEAPEVSRLALDEMEAFRAVRPRHTAMATRRLEAYLGRSPRSWQEALDAYLLEHLISR